MGGLMATKRLIDLDELMKFPIRIDHYDKVNGNEHFVFGIETVLEYAENLPTVDAVEVVHGRFIDNRCSICGGMPMGDEIFKKADIKPPRFDWFMDYCPCCGAKMDGERKDNDL